jgi:hypothetical protein
VYVSGGWLDCVVGRAAESANASGTTAAITEYRVGRSMGTSLNSDCMKTGVVPTVHRNAADGEKRLER